MSDADAVGAAFLVACVIAAAVLGARPRRGPRRLREVLCLSVAKWSVVQSAALLAYLIWG